MDKAHSSYYQKPQNSCFAYFTIPQRLENIAKLTPDKNAFVFLSPNGQRLSVLTCKEVYDRALRFARSLINIGVKKSEVVAIGLPNSPEWLICTFGTMIAGAIPMNFYFYHKDGSYLLSLCNDVKASCIVFHPGHDSKHMDILNQFIDEGDSNGQVTSKKIPSLKFAICTGKSEQIFPEFNFKLFSDFMELGKDPLKECLPCLDADDVALYMLTSGSTDRPKLIPWSHFSVLNSGKCFLGDDDPIYLNERPFNWVGGWPFNFLKTGITRVTLADLLGMKSLQDIAEFTVKAVESEKCTAALINLPCLQMFMEGKVPLGLKWPIEVIVTGGASMSEVFTQAIGPIAKRLVNVYGCSELSILAVNQITEPSTFKNYSVGDVIEGGEFKIVGENGQIVPRGEQGEIYFRSAVRFRGYVGDLNRTKDAVTEAGWYKTDDVGSMYDDGSIIVYGRNSDVIKIGGGSVIPSFLQRVLKKHPDVLDAFILPVPDAVLINVACACVMPRPGSTVTRETLREFVQQQYSHQTDTYVEQIVVPKYFVLMNTLPRTPVGKIDQKSVRAVVYAELDIQTNQ